MLNKNNIKSFFWNTLRVIAFFFIFLKCLQISAEYMLYDIYVNTPSVIFILISFFLTLFICRELSCLIFMPKQNPACFLKSTVPSETLSGTVLRVAGLSCLRHIFTYAFLVAAELVVRVVLINVFLLIINHTLPVWENLASVSTFLLTVAMAVLAYAVMECPAYFLFYRTAFKGHSPRISEYRFGIKASSFVIGVLLLQILIAPFAVLYPAEGMQILLTVILIVLSAGLWYLMYRKEWKCLACQCPIAVKIRSLLGKKCCGQVTSAAQEMEKTESEIVASVVQEEKEK